MPSSEDEDELENADAEKEKRDKKDQEVGRIYFFYTLCLFFFRFKKIYWG